MSGSCFSGLGRFVGLRSRRVGAKLRVLEPVVGALCLHSWLFILCLALIKYLTDKILWATFDRVQINLTYVKQHGAKDK